MMSGVAGEGDAIIELEKRRQNIADTAMTSDHQKQVLTHAILNQVLKAVNKEKLDVIGYVHWSLFDGFEFVTQFGESWGLVGLDWNSAARERKVGLRNYLAYFVILVIH